MQINKETIEQLFRQHYLRMYQLARVLLKDDAASKDVVSEVFADVLDGKTQLGLDNETITSDSPLPSTNVGSYLLVCVRHKCLNLLSRQKMKDRVHHLLKADTSPSIAPLEATIAEIDRETEKYEAIQAYMDAELTPQTRKVLDLRFRQKLKYREIATELGISEVAVYKHLAQGIRKLKQKLTLSRFIMDKFEKILDIIDHQEKYSDEEIHEILQDEECRKLYQTMVEVDSALESPSPIINVDEEWEKFSQKHQLQEVSHPITSWRKLAASIAGFVLISGIAFAAIHTYIKRSQEPIQITADTHPEVIKSDSAKQVAAKDSLTHPKPEKPAIHKTFENVAFEQMISEIASYYDLQVKFENNEDKTLRLYYEWNSHSSIENIVKELNQFENVNIELQQNELIVK